MQCQTECSNLNNISESNYVQIGYKTNNPMLCINAFSCNSSVKKEVKNHNDVTSYC